jgi:kumamolisin
MEGVLGVAVHHFEGPKGIEFYAPILSEDNSPYITSVGGTIVFLSTTGAYYKEAAWGEPMEQWGGGGGFSAISARPSWQKGPGLAGVNSRGIPDVSADADSNSGWAIFAPGPNGQPLEEPAGGTSASAPCWAAVTALIDEDLARRGLPSVGFADPALYYFASGPKGLPAPAFHDITEGTNLYYAAVPGWDAATGLGSPDVAHLADDFEWYCSTHQEGAP